MATPGLSNYASSFMNDYAPASSSHAQSKQQPQAQSLPIPPHRAGPSSRIGGGNGPLNQSAADTRSLEHSRSSRFVPAYFQPVKNPEEIEPWDQISDEHRSEINDCFQLFDMNKDDALDFAEYRYALQSLGFAHLPRQEILAHFEAHAHPRPNWAPLPRFPSLGPNQPTPSQSPGIVDLRLSREAFQSIAARYVASRDPREELLRTFDMFDLGGKGIITVDDLRIIVKELGEDVPENELVNMVEQFDIEQRGGINREEFLSIFIKD